MSDRRILFATLLLGLAVWALAAVGVVYLLGGLR